MIHTQTLVFADPVNFEELPGMKINTRPKSGDQKHNVWS